jgi:hypothetical protein
MSKVAQELREPERFGPTSDREARGNAFRLNVQGDFKLAACQVSIEERTQLMKAPSEMVEARSRRAGIGHWVAAHD